MTNLEIAQEQIVKEKEAKRLDLIKEQLVKKESLLKEVKEVEDKITSLETEEIVLEKKNLHSNFDNVLTSYATFCGNGFTSSN
jgi:hypothetical protein